MCEIIGCKISAETKITFISGVTVQVCAQHLLTFQILDRRSPMHRISSIEKTSSISDDELDFIV